MSTICGRLPVAVCLGVIGCADFTPTAALPHPTAQVHMVSTSADGTEYPVFASEEEARANLGYAEIYRVAGAVYWEGNTAVGTSTMDYFGNEALMKLTVTAQNVTASAVQGGSKSDTHVWPAPYNFTSSAIRAALPGSQACGGVATAAGEYTAKVIFLIQNK